MRNRTHRTCVTPRKRTLRAAELLVAAAFATLSANAAAELTYEYTGSIFLGPSAHVGKAITARFVLDETVAGVKPILSDTDNVDYPFAILSATFSFNGLEFDSKAYADFNKSTSYLTPVNRNYVKINNNIDDPNAVPNFNGLFLNIYSNETHGGLTSSTMSLRVADFPSYSAVNSPALPTSFSGLTVAPGFGSDSTSISMGYCTTSGICSTITSSNGALRVVVPTPPPPPPPPTTPIPEPETYAMLLAGLGTLSIFARHKKKT